MKGVGFAFAFVPIPFPNRHHTATSAEDRGKHLIQITTDPGQELPHCQVKNTFS